MHPQRQAYTLRLVLMFCLCAALIGYAYRDLEDAQIQVTSMSPSVTMADVTPPPLPDPQNREYILAALSWLARTATQPYIADLDPTLLSAKSKQRAVTSLSMILSRGKELMAMIDGRVFRAKDTLPDGRVLTRITKEGVTLTASGQSEHLPWIAPLSVRLEKAAVAEPQSNATSAAPSDAPATPVGQGGANLDAQQAMQLLKQLEAIKSHAQ